MTPEHYATSRDDLHVPSSTATAFKVSERRARSLSPVKNRKSLPDSFFDMKMPSLPYVNQDDIQSLSSNSSSGASGASTISLDQLKRLSHSPISKKLHINTNGDNGHVIPIPFTITLPPKLSPKNKQTRSRSPSPVRSPKPKSQSRLVFTGTGYEKLDTLSSEDEHDVSLISLTKVPIPPRPAVKSASTSVLSPRSPVNSPGKQGGPPSVTKNKRKSVSVAIQSRHLNQDQLSIIEEQSSSAASSRAGSIRNKKVDTKDLPKTPGSLPLTDINENKPASTPRSLDPGKEHTAPQPVRNISAPMVPQQDTTILSKPAPMVQSMTTANIVTLKKAPNKEKALPPIGEIKPAPTAERGLLNKETSVASLGQYLHIQKRSFSDESNVSSVSSFSVGDVMSFTSRKTKFYTLQDTPRQISNHSMSTIESGSSNDSTISGGSNNSWDSLQKSIDLSKGGSDSSFEDVESEEEVDKTVTIEEGTIEPPVPEFQNLAVQNTSVQISDAEIEIADCYLQDSTIIEQLGSKLDSESETEADESSEFDESMDKSKDDNNDMVVDLRKGDLDNKGLGKEFNFPNDVSNITNAENTKRRIISNESYKSGKSRFSYYSANGQIEIPDLSEASFSDVVSMKKSLVAVHGYTFNDLISDDDETADETLEPIGVPSQKGRRIITEQFKNLYNESDTDIESVTPSLYANAFKAKSTPNLNFKKNDDLPPLPNEIQPQAELPRQAQTPMRVNHTRNRSRHSRHKSLGNIDFNLNDLMAKEPPKTPQTQPEDMNIVITEPPKRVNYEVDFQDSTEKATDYYKNPTPTSDELKNSRQTESASSNSGTSYRSSSSSKPSNPTDLSDVESVVIDLTKDTYDVCMIQRRDSTLSYKSVTEYHRGKEVEVVIVDEDDEKDLESIYSKYGRNWLGRSESMRSTTSSNFSYNSMASEGQIKLKDLKERRAATSTLLNQRNIERTSGSVSSQASSRYNSRRIKPPSATNTTHTNQRQLQPASRAAPIEDDKYFDYAKSSSYYDFNTFINQKNQT